MSNVFVCIMGIGTVFFGLICLVFICMALSYVCQRLVKTKPQIPVAAPKKAAVTSTEIANKGEIIAAACCAIAEELGEDVKNIRVVSFKKA